MKNFLADLIIFFVAMIGIVIISLASYSNGTCKRCGGHYQYVDHNRIAYVYMCENCGYTIETGVLMD